MKKTIILSLALTFVLLPLAHTAYATSCDPYAHPGTCAANEICEGDINGGNKGTCVTTAPALGNTSSASKTVTPSNTAQGGTGFVSLTQFPQIQTLAQPTSFLTFVNTLYKVCIGAGTVLAVIMIMVAGVQFMTSKGSVASNEKAKSRIQNAVLGLVLVLAPTIVFGIINPEILHLNFGTEFEGLKLNTLNQDLFKVAAQDGPQDKQVPSNCQAYTDPKAQPVLQSCGTGQTQVAPTCCQAQTGFQCCARPVSTPAAAAKEYMWKVTVQPTIHASDPFASKQPNEKSEGPFPNQKACTDSYAAFSNFNTAKVASTQCDCSKPRSEFPACKQ